MIRRIQQYLIYADKETKARDIERVGFFLCGVYFTMILQCIIARGYILQSLFYLFIPIDISAYFSYNRNGI